MTSKFDRAIEMMAIISSAVAALLQLLVGHWLTALWASTTFLWACDSRAKRKKLDRMRKILGVE